MKSKRTFSSNYYAKSIISSAIVFTVTIIIIFTVIITFIFIVTIYILLQLLFSYYYLCITVIETHNHIASHINFVWHKARISILESIHRCLSWTIANATRLLNIIKVENHNREKPKSGHCGLFMWRSLH